MRRSGGRVALAGVVALLSLNAWAQVALVPLGRSDDPAGLTALQALVGAAVAYGVVTAGMIVALGPLLDLEAEARRGLWTGAAAFLLFAAWSTWYLRRTAARPGPPTRR